MTRHRFITLVALGAAVCTWSTVSRAAITGFGDFSAFTVNQLDGSAAPTIAGGTIHLTNQARGEARSIFCNTRQSISQFTASFTYQAANIGDPLFGAAFVVQNDPSGNHVVGSGGTYLGYAGGSPWIANSAAISLELGTGSTSASGFYTGGILGGGSSATSPVSFYSGHPIDVTLTYNGATLHEHLSDTVTSATFDASYLVNLPSIVGGADAYVGLTASTAGIFGAAGTDQYFSNFQFTSAVPEPASFGAVAFVACLTTVARRRRD